MHYPKEIKVEKKETYWTPSRPEKPALPPIKTIPSFGLGYIFFTVKWSNTTLHFFSTLSKLNFSEHKHIEKFSASSFDFWHCKWGSPELEHSICSWHISPWVLIKMRYFQKTRQILFFFYFVANYCEFWRLLINQLEFFSNQKSPKFKKYVSKSHNFQFDEFFENTLPSRKTSLSMPKNRIRFTLTLAIYAQLMFRTVTNIITRFMKVRFDKIKI